MVAICFYNVLSFSSINFSSTPVNVSNNIFFDLENFSFRSPPTLIK